MDAEQEAGAARAAARRRLGRRIAVVATLGLGLALQLVGAPLTGPDTPFGVVSLQFVADHGRALALVEGWGPAGRARAVRHLAIDLAFPLAYAAAIAGLAGAVVDRARRLGRPVPRGAARSIAVAAMAAAALDLVENAAMFATVTGRGGPWSTRLTVAMAVPKFALVLGALVGLAVIALAAARAATVGRRRTG